jgi:hypothetical protein
MLDPKLSASGDAMAYDLRVAFWDPVQPHHLRQAAAEYDSLGQDEVSRTIRIWSRPRMPADTRREELRLKGHLGVSYQLATGRPLRCPRLQWSVDGTAGTSGGKGMYCRDLRSRTCQLQRADNTN